MKRYDLRHLKDDFEPRMKEILGTHKAGEVAIFIFEIGISLQFKDLWIW